MNRSTFEPPTYDAAADGEGRNALFQRVYERLERLARKMLLGFPRVRRWDETADVLQNSLIRLLRAIDAVHPQTEREFFGLAAEQIRRELLDLARRYYGPQGLGANHESNVSPEPVVLGAETVEELERWTEFHETVALLPAEEQEVFGLLFYLGHTQPEVARLCHINERTVRRRWRKAVDAIRVQLGTMMPHEAH